jgi:hypothetical protein
MKKHLFNAPLLRRQELAQIKGGYAPWLPCYYYCFFPDGSYVLASGLSNQSPYDICASIGAEWYGGANCGGVDVIPF